jgi:hypothetical protein
MMVAQVRWLVQLRRQVELHILLNSEQAEADYQTFEQEHGQMAAAASVLLMIRNPAATARDPNNSTNRTSH